MKTGRNDACPCGSGKKYKKCCGLKGAGTTGALAAQEHGLFREQMARFQEWAQTTVFDGEEILDALYELYYDTYAEGDPDLPLLDELILHDVEEWGLFELWEESGYSRVESGIRNGSLPEALVELGEALLAGIFSLYEVREVLDGGRLRLRELVSGTEWIVYHDLAEESLGENVAFYGRISRFRSIRVLTGGSWIPLPQPVVESMMDVREDLRESLGEGEVDWRDVHRCAGLLRTTMVVHLQFFMDSVMGEEKAMPDFFILPGTGRQVVAEFRKDANAEGKAAILAWDGASRIEIPLTKKRGTVRIEMNAVWLDVRNTSEDPEAMDRYFEEILDRLAPWLPALPDELPF